MAVAPGRLLGRALRAAQASSHADALRLVMYTFEQPAWRKLGVGGVSGRLGVRGGEKRDEISGISEGLGVRFGSYNWGSLGGRCWGMG